MLSLRTGFPQIIVDDLDPFARPAKAKRAVDKPILKRRAFLVMADLADARLTDIDIGQLGLLRGAYPFIYGIISQHRCHRRSGQLGASTKPALSSPPADAGLLAAGSTISGSLAVSGES